MSKRYFWDRVYELREKHWALCDTESAPEGRVSDYNLVLNSTSEECIDGRPLSEQELPKRIVDLLNRDEASREKAQKLADAWKAWSDAEGWDNNEWDDVIEALDSLLGEFGVSRDKRIPL